MKKLLFTINNNSVLFLGVLIIITLDIPALFGVRKFLFAFSGALTMVMIAFVCILLGEKKYKYFLVALIMVLSVLLTPFLINKAWPAENAVHAEENLAAIMKQAENWPVVYVVTKSRIVGKWHSNPNNHNQMVLILWFPNKDKSYQLEFFAKNLYLLPNLVPIKATLKKEDGEWAIADNIMISLAKFNGEDAVAFRLFDKQNSIDPAALRIFLLKDLISP